MIEALEMLEARTVEHKQQRDDLTGRQTGLRPARCRPTGAQQRRLPLRQERLAEIIDLAKNLDDPIQHHRLHHSAMAAYLKKPFSYNPGVSSPPISTQHGVFKNQF